MNSGNCSYMAKGIFINSLMSFLTRAHLAVSSFYLPGGHNSELLNVEVLLFFCTVDSRSIITG